MKKTFKETINFPEGVSCEISHDKITFHGHGASVAKGLSLPKAILKVENHGLLIHTTRADKKLIANIRSFIAHLHNVFEGLKNKYVYEMEICNVHFPMTVKVEGSEFVITNFLGEKQKRKAKILPGASVEVKGTKVIVSSHDLEAAGQTAANIEKATHVAKRDRRVFQDGIFITEKPGREIANG